MYARHCGVAPPGPRPVQAPEPAPSRAAAQRWPRTRRNERRRPCRAAAHCRQSVPLQVILGSFGEAGQAFVCRAGSSEAEVPDGLDPPTAQRRSVCTRIGPWSCQRARARRRNPSTAGLTVRKNRWVSQAQSEDPKPCSATAAPRMLPINAAQPCSRRTGSWHHQTCSRCACQRRWSMCQCGLAVVLRWCRRRPAPPPGPNALPTYR